MGQPPLQQRCQRGPIRIRVTIAQQIGRRDAQRMRQQQPGLQPRPVDARRTQPRSRFVENVTDRGRG